jgi:hypothetical protein
MFKDLRHYVFALYEHRLLRNWFYTLAFGIFVPVGGRLAYLAWEAGNDFDRFMTIIAGLAAGITAVVTLMRIWAVPPRKTVPQPTEMEHHETVDLRPRAAELLALSRARAARNWQIARGARALGSPRTFRR